MQFLTQDDFHQTFGETAEVHEKELGRDYKLTVGVQESKFFIHLDDRKALGETRGILELYWGDELSVLADVSVSSRALDDPEAPGKRPGRLELGRDDDLPILAYVTVFPRAFDGSNAV